MPDRRVYPPVLKAVIRHALRFGALIEAQGVSGPPIGLAQAWLVGRPREIQAVIALLIADWEKGRYDAEGAAAAGCAYLEELHAAFRGLRGSSVELTCCDLHPDRSLAVAGLRADPAIFDPHAVLRAVGPIDPAPGRLRVGSGAPPPPISGVGTATVAAQAPSGSPAAPPSPLARVK